MRFRSKTMLGGTILVLLLLLGGVCWQVREPLTGWYALRGLENATEEERSPWVERVSSLNEAAVPGLLTCLRRDDPRICANARAALETLVRRWPGDDPRGVELARKLEECFPRLSDSGRREVLHLGCIWLAANETSPPCADVARSLARLLPDAGPSRGTEVRRQALDLALKLLDRPEPGDAVPSCRELAVACFGDAEVENRKCAVQIALHPGMDLQRQVLPLLRDSAAEVRRLAILVVGPAQDVIVSEDLLRWLHDSDAEVRRLCEMALRGRRLPEAHIRLGRLLTHETPQVRMEVLDHLYRAPDLDPGVWLRYLSHDRVPSVRAAAMRASTSGPYESVAFSDRLEQMRSDPSPTVGQLAQHFLPLKKRQEAQSSQSR